MILVEMQLEEVKKRYTIKHLGCVESGIKR